MLEPLRKRMTKDRIFIDEEPEVPRVGDFVILKGIVFKIEQRANKGGFKYFHRTIKPPLGYRLAIVEAGFIWWLPDKSTLDFVYELMQGIRDRVKALETIIVDLEARK